MISVCLIALFVGGCVPQTSDGEARKQWMDPEEPSALANGESTGFGHSLAWLGEDLLLGAPRSFRNGERGGEVWWIPARVDSKLSELPTPASHSLASDLPARDWQALGYDIATSDSHGMVAISAPLAPSVGLDPGYVYLVASRDHLDVFSGGLSGDGSDVQTLIPENTPHSAGFGSVVEWSERDLWVAAPYATGPFGLHGSGYVACYGSGTNGFEEQCRVLSPLPSGSHKFGEAFLVVQDPGGDSNSDGLVVGAPGSLAGGVVHVYGLDPLSERQRLGLADSALASEMVGTPSQRDASEGQGESAEFGRSLAISDCGEWLFVGAPALGGEGAVCVYRKNPVGEFQLVQWLRAPAGYALTRFGQSIAWDRDVLWVGAPGGDGAVAAFPGPFDVPPLARVWVGTNAGEALGSELLPKRLMNRSPGHSLRGAASTNGVTEVSRCIVSAPGRGVVTFETPVKCRVIELESPPLDSTSQIALCPGELSDDRAMNRGDRVHLRWLRGVIGTGERVPSSRLERVAPDVLRREGVLRAVIWGLRPFQGGRFGWASASSGETGDDPWTPSPESPLGTAFQADADGRFYMDLPLKGMDIERGILTLALREGQRTRFSVLF